MHIAYDRNRNPLRVGAHVIENGTRNVMVIKAINDKNLAREKIRAAKCVVCNDSNEYYAPQDLILLGH
ncbi:selenium-binding protein [Hafnia paralvei]|jgi:putative selenium-binding protein YdfZ|uniref:Selenium-binding protein n=1 Tax=Hafnia paralvei TaxID=546367 RepID=A0A2A2MEV8_9GAMM|nr:putative selenium delivery protein YdfZ [Hafnia paralvei]KHS47172.1 selenium-binding protein [Hafnia paralvei]MBU2674564.1 putative selenium delivery protein YdfZ [Hafnia paralvei]PAV97401.1 selenium-binding protein [Hafnia paralvei]RDA64242.1 putative selenium delivery protein YdfZ [Hafnia paralvei]RDA64957.1 putative selenium delivery protein YdfZ [Hafnia paralvei]